LNAEGLRPTSDRIRETVFNWLADDLPGATVLDCFAGAGGLGLEAASRRAARVILVEKDPRVAKNLTSQSERLQADNVTIKAADVLKVLDHCDMHFDVVFIDPPYSEPALRDKTIKKLIDRDLMKPGCKIYLEWPAGQQMLLSDNDLIWLKQKEAGQVGYGVAQWQ
jgi:16S rRNA (guanine966-N2)-methyltransferase